MAYSNALLAAILVGGGVAGVLDLLDAFVFFGLRNGVAPSRILQSIASGLVGASAFRGGWRMAALGVTIHFLIAFSAAAAYVLASVVVPALLRYAVPCGLAFGVGFYFFMNEAVLPLSAVAKGGPPPWPVFLNGIAIHALGIGLPIALIARRFIYSRS